MRTETEITELLEPLQEQLEQIGSKIAGLRKELGELRSPFKAGDTIRWQHGNGFRTGIVKSVVFRSWDNIPREWIVSFVKKDGSLGAPSSVHSYAQPEKVS
jgi:hypothetical protein